jgi:hypothetical protein
MLSTLYHKKAFVLKIPLHPPLPKGDHKDYSHIFKWFLPTHFHDEPKKGVKPYFYEEFKGEVSKGKELWVILMFYRVI